VLISIRESFLLEFDEPNPFAIPLTNFPKILLSDLPEPYSSLFARGLGRDPCGLEPSDFLDPDPLRFWFGVPGLPFEGYRADCGALLNSGLYCIGGVTGYAFEASGGGGRREAIGCISSLMGEEIMDETDCDEE
jgi:hypothetical protein